MNERQFGPRLTADGASFRLWAPAAKRVDLLLEKSHAMRRGEAGWFVAEVPGVKAGARYKFRIDDDIDVPDPASAFQPDDVSGPSEVIDQASYRWRAADWRGRPWPETVLIETHVGTFTPEGTFRAMIDKLDHLVATGITALELMPLADFAGPRNWGYDGVLWYAPDSAYGRPDDLKALIDAAHLRGLMVFLDVVYNHFGPEGNYLGRYAPGFFTEAQTPWGSAIDYRVPEVRAFAIENALYWLRDYRFDGLRLDAVHAIAELGETSMLHDLSVGVGQLAAETGRHIHLVLENDDNAASLLDADEDPPHGKYRAQWNDDYHHAWHVLLTAESHGYYRDYQRSPRSDIARALGSGFVYQGEASAHRGGRLRGEPSGALSPTAFVNFLQNHDQIGNRAARRPAREHGRSQGDRGRAGDHAAGADDPHAVHGRGMGIDAAVPVLLRFSRRSRRRRPRGPAQGIRGRLCEASATEMPDPLDASTFRSAVLDWDALGETGAKSRLALVRDLLAIRQREIVPRLAGAAFGDAHAADNGIADGALAHGRRRNAAADRQPVGKRK